MADSSINVSVTAQDEVAVAAINSISTIYLFVFFFEMKSGNVTEMLCK